MTLDAEDCSRLEPQPDPETAVWLAELARSVRAGNHVLTLGRSRDQDEPVVFCEWDGRWRTGRYIGSISFKGHTLTIRPRLGLDTLRKWLARANNLLFVESPGTLREDASFIAELVARVWAHGLADAARHGLPALRDDHVHVGRAVRGRLDLASTVASRAIVHQQLVSIRRERTLDNPIARAIACAYGVLRRWVGTGRDREWLPQRCQELLPQLLAATGPSPALPSESELARIRYTPITERYRRFVRLSWQIARQRGLFADSVSEGQSTGVLLDVAELWELYVLSVLREAALPRVVAHGTHEQRGRDFLLYSDVDGSPLAELRPDAVIEDHGQVRCILDAKYKFLHDGPAREDLYQLGSYIMRFGAAVPMWGALIYPRDPNNEEATYAERKNPWRIEPTRTISLLTIPHEPSQAVAQLRDILATSW